MPTIIHGYSPLAPSLEHRLKMIEVQMSLLNEERLQIFEDSCLDTTPKHWRVISLPAQEGTSPQNKSKYIKFTQYSKAIRNLVPDMGLGEALRVVENCAGLPPMSIDLGMCSEADLAQLRRLGAVLEEIP